MTASQKYQTCILSKRNISDDKARLMWRRYPGRELTHSSTPASVSPALNPIDMIWSAAKNWVASSNKKMKAEKVIRRCLSYSSYFLI
jgi:hypothetical protein